MEYYQNRANVLTVTQQKQTKQQNKNHDIVSEVDWTGQWTGVSCGKFIWALAPSLVSLEYDSLRQTLLQVILFSPH